jgi:hypothetical protein
MFQNEYEPDNSLQKLWDSTQGGGCLCTMRESCSVCSNFSERLRQSKLIKQLAKEQGYQLYSKAWMKTEHFKVNMEA